MTTLTDDRPRDLRPNGRCSTCRARVWFGVTEKGRRIPLDPGERFDGNLWLHNDGNGWVVLSVTEATDAAAPRYVAHFVTCPDAARHRKR